MQKILKLFILTVSDLNMFLEKLKKLSDIKTKKNIFRIQANNSIMCGYFGIGLINVIFADKALILYTNLFSPS